jgi:hypothetical protein
MSVNKNELRAYVRGLYDLQDHRMRTGSRVISNYKSKLGLKPGMKEEELEEKARNFLKQIKSSYSKITQGIGKLPTLKKFTGDAIISSYAELVLIDQFIEVQRKEEQGFRRLKMLLLEFPIYSNFLINVTGVGPAMSGVIISEIDIEKAEYPSSLRKLAGIDVGPDGKGRSKKEAHLIDVDYIDKNGDEKTKKSITYNPFLKTKLTGVLAGLFIKCGNERYSKVYYDYRNRLDNHPVYKDESKKHKQSMANRKMLNMFLQDLYVAWRTLEGLPLSKPYHEAKLGYEAHPEDVKPSDFQKGKRHLREVDKDPEISKEIFDTFLDKFNNHEDDLGRTA